MIGSDVEHIERVWPEWKVVELIGRGGFGSVYKAERTAGGYTTTSAIKVISIPSSETEVDDLRSMGMDALSVRSYFEDTAKGVIQEVATMDRLKGAPHIVHVEDYYLEEKGDGIGWTILIRMELLESLRNYQLRVGSPDQRETAKIGRDICDALRCCHEVGIIHRDVKPGNIFLSAYGDYKLGDFGVARRLGDSTRSGLSMAGTGPYMAPEIPSGSYDKTVDTYSLGIMLYQYLNGGRLPFLPVEGTVTQSDMQRAQTRRLLGERPPLPAGEGVDPNLATIVRKACEPNPADRWQSAAEMGDALKRWLDGSYTAEAAAETASSWTPAQTHVASVPVGSQTVNLGDFFAAPRDSSGSAAGSVQAPVAGAPAGAQTYHAAPGGVPGSAGGDPLPSIAEIPSGTQTFRVGDYLGPRPEAPVLAEAVHAPAQAGAAPAAESESAAQLANIAGVASTADVVAAAQREAHDVAVEALPEKSGRTKLLTILVELAASVAFGVLLYFVLMNSSDSRGPENAIGIAPFTGGTLFLALLFGIPLVKRIVSGRSAEKVCGIASLGLGLIVFFWIFVQLGYDSQYDGLDYFASICLFIINLCLIGSCIIDALLRLVSGASKKRG